GRRVCRGCNRRSREVGRSRARGRKRGCDDPMRLRWRILAGRYMSYSPSQPSPAPPLSRASMVIGLYGAMALVALVIAAGRGDPDLYRFASEPRWPLLAGPIVGILVGLGVVGLT